MSSHGKSPAAILVVVPTTGGPLTVRSLRVRPGLPASSAFAEGDYRPLPWSGDYARLAAPGGPLAALAQAGPHELRLSGSFDAGRSWEVPVCLAHGLLARGHRLVAGPEEADLILWATGAVDLDLAVLPGDYALLDKIERSRALLAAAPRARLAVLLPEGPERAEAERAFAALGRAVTVLPGATVPAALAALAEPATPAGARQAAPGPRRRYALPAMAGLAAIVALGAVYARAPSPSAPVAPTSHEIAAPEITAHEPAAPPTPAKGEPILRVEELLAPAGSSCRRVAFGADAPERRAVPEDAEGRLRPSRLVPELCGLAVRTTGPALRVEVGAALRAASLPPSLLPDGAQAYFLREGGRQNLVYVAQAVPEAVPEAGPAPPGARLTHALTR